MTVRVLCLSGGVLEARRVLPDGLAYEARVTPAPDGADGETALARGRVFVYEGEDLKGEVSRRLRAGTLFTSAP
jgi:hypothetical protein